MITTYGRRLTSVEVECRRLAESFNGRMATTHWDFTPTHSALAFNAYGDPYEMPMMRTGCTMDGLTEWRDENHHFTYMTESQAESLLMPMMDIPVF